MIVKNNFEIAVQSENKNNRFENIMLLLIMAFTAMYIVFHQVHKTSVLNLLGFLIVFCVLISPIEINIYQLAFISPYFMLIAIAGTACINFMIFIVFAKLVIKKLTAPTLVIYITIIFLFVEVFFKLLAKQSFTTSMFHWVISLALFSWLIVDSEIYIDSSKIIKWYCCAMTVVSCTVIIYNWGKSISVFTRNDIIANAYLEKNFYALFILIMITSVINYMLVNGFSVVYTIMIGIGFISALFMISKSFLITTALCLLLYFVFLINKPKHWIIFISLVAVAIFIILSNERLNEIFNIYLERFTLAKDIDQLTTGRSNIYKDYIRYLLDHPLTLFFGGGLFSFKYKFQVLLYGTNIPASPHNIFIELISSWGIIGGIAFIILLILFYRNYLKRFVVIRKSLIGYIPLFAFIFGLQSLQYIYERNFFLFVFYIFNCITFYRSYDSKTKKMVYNQQQEKDSMVDT